ncbi:MAG: hypothetical protein EBR10_10110 [Planctomycetes bacterium]|nr:hypothetical protein [Planctomycetota bacterium]
MVGESTGGKSIAPTPGGLPRPTEFSAKSDATAVATTGPSASTPPKPAPPPPALVQQPAPEPPPAPPSDADLNKAIADFAAGRISGNDLEAALAGEPTALEAGDAGQLDAPADPAPVMSEVTRLTIEAANAALAQIRGGPKSQPYGGPLKYVGTDWNALFARAANNDMMFRMLMQIVDIGGREGFIDPNNYRRFDKLGSMPQKLIDPMVNGTPAARKELFALATVDTTQTHWMMTNGSMAAVAAKFSSDPVLLERALNILSELNKYQPMQRTGWTSFDPSVAIPADGDGVWLATGWGLTAMAEMCSILGDAVPPELLAKLKEQAREEIKRICVDWRDRRPWFVKSNNSVTNQWIEPNIGLVRACLFLGDAELLPAYNLGVENLLASLAAHGERGEFLEGVSYAEMSLRGLHEVSELMRLSGDTRAAGSGFGANNWKWFAQMHLPGGLLVNCNDSKMSVLPDYSTTVPLSAFSSGALAVGSTSASDLKFLYPNPTPIGSIDALKYADFLASNGSAGPSQLSTFAHFPGQEMVVWRSRFEPIVGPQSAFALWVKGGTVRENHIHREQGHLTIVVGNRIVLSNCGTAEYNAPDYLSGYAGVGGKSMMQIGQLIPTSQPVNAPMFVNTLGPAGGNVDINTSAAYPGSTCTRNVSWDSAGNVRVIDNVSLASAAAAGVEIYRFHTGSSQPLTITGSDKEWDVAWNGTSLQISADSPIVVDQVTSPNKIRAPNQHQTIQIKTKNGTSRLQLVSDFAIDLAVTQ